LDFDAELSPRAEIKSKWARQAQWTGLNRRLPLSRFAWASILIILAVLLVAFRQPVFAAVSRVFRYIYVSEVGFLPMDSTHVLEQSIRQEHDGQSVTVRRGVAIPQGIILFLEFDDIAHPVDGARLETGSGGTLELVQWEYWPNTPNSHGVKMTFPPLPAGVTRTMLSLPEGWHLPLNWIPASQSNLPNTRVVTYVSATEEPASSPDLCVEKWNVL
jgi:hypothetical protein